MARAGGMSAGQVAARSKKAGRLAGGRQGAKEMAKIITGTATLTVGQRPPISGNVSITIRPGGDCLGVFGKGFDMGEPARHLASEPLRITLPSGKRMGVTMLALTPEELHFRATWAADDA